ncbi:MAG: hypothetical protein IBX50_07675 [Marinospirillum sp.]|uniref:hypothetical protein n=1 Tax=Marinospirillum sp. TaxID=2183934 RepID=UPI0019DCE160|nr:hypothetical protein [Marinospirillum sp.]MBE0506586.1 hypothetical protein [Marinospirillum sp.]
MDHLQIPYSLLLNSWHLIALALASTSSALSGSLDLAVSSFSTFPQEFQGRAWNEFAANVEAARSSGSTADVYKQFVYLVLRVMAFMTFGLTLYDTALVLAGQGSAGEVRGGKGKALSKNLLILVVSVLTFEAETVLGGVWTYLSSARG